MRCVPAIALVVACAAPDPAPARLLVFTRTLGYRHADAIDAGTQVLPARLLSDGIATDVTEDPAVFTDGNLARYRAVFFLYTSGNDVLDATGKTALERFVRGGGGWIGIHSAVDTEYLWPFYQQMIAAPFHDHPAIQPASVVIVDPAHPAMVGLPSPWLATDEWYNFANNPRAAGAQILATIDEQSYTGGTMGPDHPMIWCHEALGGRVFYSELGHVAARWQEPAFVALVAGGARWVMR
jgi:uncharacterized protein